MFKKNIKKKDIIKNFKFKTGFSLNLSKKIIDDLIQNIFITNIKKKEILI